MRLEELERRDAPTVTLANPGTQFSYDGDAVNLQLAFTDTGSSPYISTQANLPSGLSAAISGSNVVISGTLSSWAHNGSAYSVTIGVADMMILMDSASQTFTWNVTQPTVILTNPGTQNNFDGDTVSLQLSATEDANHALSYSVTGGMLPSGLMLNSSTGVISGTISNMAHSMGPYSVTVTATDSAANVSNSKTFAWNVSNPVSAAADSYTISHDLTMATAWSLRDSVLANDTDGAGRNLTAVLVSQPMYATIEFNEDGSFVYTPQYQFVGVDHFTYLATDGIASSSPITVTINVTNATPTAINLSNSAIKIYDTAVGTLSAEDPDYLETFSFSLVDFVNHPDNANFNIQDDQLVLAPYASLAPGDYQIKVQATDGGGLSTTQDFTITVQSVSVWISSVQDAVQGQSTGYFRLQRSDTTNALTVSYSINTELTDAVAGTDYAPLSGYATFAAGQQVADILVQACGGDVKQLSIELAPDPRGIGVAPAARRPLLMGPPPNPDAPAPTFGSPAYTFYVGEGSYKDISAGQVSATSATGRVRYSIVGGNTDGLFGIDGTGNIKPLRDVPLVRFGDPNSYSSYALTVRATDYNGRTADVSVAINLKPLVLVYGDYQGVMAPIGANGLRDRIILTFIRITGNASPSLTVDYAITWDADARAKLDNASIAVLRNGEGETGSIRFRGGERRASITLTPQVAGDQLSIKNFRVTVTDRSTEGNFLRSYVSDLRYQKMDLGRRAPGWLGRNDVTISILPNTTVFGASNQDSNLADGPWNGLWSYPANINDISQGSVGDCYFLAAIGAMAQRTPADVESLFLAEPSSGKLVWADGRVRIKTYTQPGINPNAYEWTPVYATLARGDSQAWLSMDYQDAGNVRAFELWPQLLERYWAQRVGWENFANGGWASEVWPTLTGRNATYVGTTNVSVDDIAANLQAAISANQKVVLDSRWTEKGWTVKIPGDSTEYYLTGPHAYILQSIDANGIVTLYNPHSPLAPYSPVKFRIADFKTYFLGYEYQEA